MILSKVNPSGVLVRGSVLKQYSQKTLKDIFMMPLRNDMGSIALTLISNI